MMRKGMVLPAVLAGLLLAGAGAGTAMAAGNGDGTREAAAALSMRTLMESLRQVSSDVAHDLRTPLTRLYQRLEGARASASTVTEYEAAVDAASAEADELLKTFASLLRIAQVEGAPPAAGFGPVDLSALAETVADAYQPDMEAQHHRLDTAIEPGIMIWGDRELLTQAFANVVENALRHTPAGTLIRVALGRRPDGSPSLSVVDDGPGVSGDDLPKLAQRFFRGEHSRTTPGNGLGLALAHAVAGLHDARLEIEASRPGLRVAFHFTASAWSACDRDRQTAGARRSSSEAS